MTENVTHTPVLLNEIVEFLKPPAGSRYPYVIYDGTLGGAGHAQALLLSDTSVFLLGVDRDSWALERARNLLGEFSARAHLVHGLFSDLAKHLQSLPQAVKDYPEGGQPRCQAILVDLGVSSFQFDLPERGFSFRNDAPLDMRMDQQQGLDACGVVNDYELPALKRVLLRGGVGAPSGRIARVLVDSRPIESTKQLALACQQALRFETPATVRQTTTVIFQAIRIEVNDELGEIERLLDAIPEHLAPGGTAAVISFHSSEDRLVASRMRDWSRPKQPLRDIPQADIPPLGELVTAKALVPSQEEIARNPRARSARLRVFRRGDRGNNQVQ